MGDIPEAEKKTSKMKEKKKIAKHVPYQLCPKCRGEGTLMTHGNPFGQYPNTNISIGFETCDVCGGAKIVPMCPVKTLVR